MYVVFKFPVLLVHVGQVSMSLYHMLHCVTKLPAWQDCLGWADLNLAWAWWTHWYKPTWWLKLTYQLWLTWSLRLTSYDADVKGTFDMTACLVPCGWHILQTTCIFMELIDALLWKAYLNTLTGCHTVLILKRWFSQALNIPLDLITLGNIRGRVGFASSLIKTFLWYISSSTCDSSSKLRILPRISSIWLYTLVPGKKTLEKILPPETHPKNVYAVFQSDVSFEHIQHQFFWQA